MSFWRPYKCFWGVPTSTVVGVSTVAVVPALAGLLSAVDVCVLSIIVSAAANPTGCQCSTVVVSLAAVAGVPTECCWLNYVHVVVGFLHAVASFTNFASIPAIVGVPTEMAVLLLLSFLLLLAFLLFMAVMLLLSHLLLLFAGINAAAYVTAVS